MQHFTSLQVRRLPREVIFLVFTCEINDKQNLNKTIAVRSTTKSRDLAISLKGGPACTIEKYPCSCLRFSFIPGDFHSCWNRRLTQRLAEIIDMENRAVHVWAAERRSLCSVCVIRQKPLRVRVREWIWNMHGFDAYVVNGLFSQFKNNRIYGSISWMTRVHRRFFEGEQVKMYSLLYIIYKLLV